MSWCHEFSQYVIRLNQVRSKLLEDQNSFHLGSWLEEKWPEKQWSHGMGQVQGARMTDSILFSLGNGGSLV